MGFVRSPEASEVDRFGRGRGDKRRRNIHYAFGTAPSVDQAVRDAVQEVRDLTGDDSYLMNEWWGML